MVYAYTKLAGDPKALEPYVKEKLIRSCADYSKYDTGWRVDGTTGFGSDTDVELWLNKVDSLLEPDSYIILQDYWDSDARCMYKKHDDGRWYYYTASVVYTLQEPVDLSEVLQWR